MKYTERKPSSPAVHKNLHSKNKEKLDEIARKYQKTLKRENLVVNLER